MWEKIIHEISCFQTSGNNFLIILHAQGIYGIDFLLSLVSKLTILKKLQLIWWSILGEIQVAKEFLYNLQSL